ncbi:MAG: 3-deoxy-7-phosphoheptulonate synthase [Deltaproteobacteria bacterium]|nr:3-deoxy-7-phosphoheptulonate synthase [Deltaproteobacteria bacterium]
MVITLQPFADIDAVRRALVARGLWVSLVRSAQGAPSHFVVDPGSSPAEPSELARIEGVASVGAAPSPHPRVDAQGPVVDVRGLAVGGARPVFLCGPCGVESEDQLQRIAAVVASAGAHFLRGGAFKPRTSPYAFQGHGSEALRWLRRTADRHGLRVVTEVLAEGDVPLVAEHADLMQVGSRNMQNFALLKAVGRAGRPVLLKRAMSATVAEWLLAGEYLLVHGAPGVVFCERGIRSFDPSTRNLLDLGAVALLSQVHRVPVVVDPSHATGRRELVGPLSKAALAAGAAGVMIECHDDPGGALSDGPQALLPQQLRDVLASLGGTV